MYRDPKTGKISDLKETLKLPLSALLLQDVETNTSGFRLCVQSYS